MTKEENAKIEGQNTSIDALDNSDMLDDVRKALHDTIVKGGEEGAEGINATDAGAFDLNEDVIASGTEAEGLIGVSADGDDLNTRSSGAKGEEPSSTSDVAAAKDTDEAEGVTATGAITSDNNQANAPPGGSRKPKGVPLDSASKSGHGKGVVDDAVGTKGRAAANVAKARADKTNNDEDTGSILGDGQQSGEARRDSVAKLISASKVVAHKDREGDVPDIQQENEGLARAQRTSRKRKSMRKEDSEDEEEDDDEDDDEDDERTNEGGIPPPPPGAADGQYQYPYQYYPYGFPHPDSYKNGAPPPGVPPPPPPGAAGVPPPPPPADDEGSDKDGKDKDGEGRSQQSAAAAAAAAAAAHYGYQYYPYYYQMYAGQQGGQYSYPAGPRYPYYAGYGNYDASGQHPMLPTEDGKATGGGHGSDSDHKKDRPSKKRKGESSNGAMASTERPYPCQFQGCHWSFARISDQRRHLRSHQEPTFHCPYWPSDPTCHKNKGAFNRLDVLKRHLRLVHFVQFKQSDSGWCRVCQKMFPSPKHFVDHCEKCAQAARPTEWQVNDNRELVQTGRGRGNVTVTDSQIGPEDPTIYSMGGNASQDEENEEITAKDEEEDEDEEERVATKVRVARPPTSNRQTLSNAIQAGHHAGHSSNSPPSSAAK